MATATEPREVHAAPLPELNGLFLEMFSTAQRIRAALDAVTRARRVAA